MSPSISYASLRPTPGKLLEHMFVSAIFMGIGVDLMYPVTNVFFMAHFPPAAQALAVALCNTAYFLGVTTLVGISQLVSELTIPTEAKVQRLALWFGIGATLVAVGIALFSVSVSKAWGRWTFEEKEQEAADMAAALAEASAAMAAARLRRQHQGDADRRIARRRLLERLPADEEMEGAFASRVPFRRPANPSGLGVCPDRMRERSHCQRFTVR